MPLALPDAPVNNVEDFSTIVMKRPVLRARERQYAVEKPMIPPPMITTGRSLENVFFSPAIRSSSLSKSLGSATMKGLRGCTSNCAIQNTRWTNGSGFVSA